MGLLSDALNWLFSLRREKALDKRETGHNQRATADRFSGAVHLQTG
tara:strand:- start:257 stop:394 length:138 start_codon:yes stop_codon:yes gene_type:complete